MSVLENKYIPLLASNTYTIEIKPKKIDPQGRIRTPEEIKNGTKDFIHTIYIDKLGNVYIVPAKMEDNMAVEYYNHEDIIKAALGDENAKALILNAHNEIQSIFKKNLVTDSFLQRLYDHMKDVILPDINRHRIEDGELPLTITLPKSIKTMNNFTQYELLRILQTALNK